MNTYIIIGGSLTLIVYLVMMRLPFFKMNVRRSGNLTMFFVFSAAFLGVILGVLKLGR